MDEKIELITQVGLDQKRECSSGRPILISAFTITAIKWWHVIHLSIFYPLFPNGVVGVGAEAYMSLPVFISLKNVPFLYVNAEIEIGLMQVSEL